jgi:hypothetical protein
MPSAGIDKNLAHRADDYVTTMPIDAIKLGFTLSNLGITVRNVHDCVQAVRLIDQAYDQAELLASGAPHTTHSKTGAP